MKTFRNFPYQGDYNFILRVLQSDYDHNSLILSEHIPVYPEYIAPFPGEGAHSYSGYNFVTP